MRVGGGGPKGGSFERLVCSQLSLWVTNGGRADIFSRNVLSGGRFTNQIKKGGELGVPGDITGTLPEAHKFLSLISVECKHNKNIRLEHYLLDDKRKSFLHQTIELERTNATISGRHYMVVARQNNRPTLMFTAPRVMACAVKCGMQKHPFTYHLLHNETVAVVKWDRFLDLVYSDRFLKEMKKVPLCDQH
jgi:hypothetical protein